MIICIDKTRQDNSMIFIENYFLFLFQSFDRIPEKTHEFNEEDEDAFDEEEESKFCTLPRSNNGFTIRHVRTILITIYKCQNEQIFLSRCFNIIHNFSGNTFHIKTVSIDLMVFFKQFSIFHSVHRTISLLVFRHRSLFYVVNFTHFLSIFLFVCNAGTFY